MSDRTNIPRRGFTLIELVIVIAIVGVIAGLFVTYLNNGTRMFEAVDARMGLTMEARQAMIRAVREIRQVRSSTDIITASADTLSFYGADDSLVTLGYSGTPGDDLILTRGPVSGTIASGVDSLAFSYFKNDGTPAVPVVSPGDTDVYRVSVFLRLESGSVEVSLGTGTFLRNVR